MKNHYLPRSPRLRLAYLSPLLLLASSCSDLIEPDITGEKVSLLSPADGSRSTTAVQGLQWSAVAHARTYRVQLATPSFANPSRLLLDSVVKQTNLTRTCKPGRYEWRVQALNAGYATAFTTRSFRIDSTGSLSGQTVQLLLPAAGTATNAATLTFSWAALPMAQQYRLAVSSNPRNSSLAALDSLVGAGTSVTLRLARQSQSYQWKVTALNASGQAASAPQVFAVDVTPPTAPTLVTPAAATSFLTQPIALSWTRTASDVAQDSVFLYRTDQTTLLAGFPRFSGPASLSLSNSLAPLTAGTYYWAVRSVDKAGNVGPASAKRAFVLQ